MSATHGRGAAVRPADRVALAVLGASVVAIAASSWLLRGSCIGAAAVDLLRASGSRWQLRATLSRRERAARGAIGSARAGRAPALVPHARPGPPAEDVRSVCTEPAVIANVVSRFRFREDGVEAGEPFELPSTGGDDRRRSRGVVRARV